MKTKLPNYRILIPAFVGLLCPLGASADNDKVLFETSFEQPEQLSELGIRNDQVAAEGNTGDASLIFKQRRFSLPSKPIPINPDLACRLQGSFKAADGSEGTPVFMSLRYFDQQGEPISNFGIIPVPGTETVLKADANTDEREILLENSGQDWPVEGIYAVAFGAKKDYSDIPNRNVYKISSVTQGEDGLRVSLEDPLTTDFPADTPVRWHWLAGPPVVLVIPSQHWEEFSLTVKGSTSPGDSWKQIRGSFWPGAAAVQITLGFKERDSVEEGREIWVDDIRLSQPAD